MLVDYPTLSLEKQAEVQGNITKRLLALKERGAGLLKVHLDLTNEAFHATEISGADLPLIDYNLADALEPPGTYTVVVTTAFAWESGEYRLGLVPVEGLGAFALYCADLPGGSTSTPAPPYSGSWSGRIVDSAGGRGAVIANLIQTGNASVDGTWEATFSWGKTSGTLVGLIQSEGLFVELYPSDPTACPFSGLAELAGYTISGAYTAFNCTVPIAGSISLTKRP